jgi:uridine phosphorylase
MDETIPVLGFDPERQAIIEPARIIRHRDVPENCVLCFFREVIEQAAETLGVYALSPLKSEMGEIPVFHATQGGKTFGIAPAAVGAPLAAGFLEELIARGGRRFVACGGSGVLDRSIPSGHIVVPTAAVRDEGTSYQYLPADRDAYPSPNALAAVTRVLDRRNVEYAAGKTWTTDAFYRETPRRVATRRDQGCVTVEMEAAALFAVAEFRNVDIALLLYGGDDVSGVEWDPRSLGRKIPARETLFWLAVEACLEIEDTRPEEPDARGDRGPA